MVENLYELLCALSIIFLFMQASYVLLPKLFVFWGGSLTPLTIVSHTSNAEHSCFNVSIHTRILPANGYVKFGSLHVQNCVYN
jgi:hypothetical protein